MSTMKHVVSEHGITHRRAPTQWRDGFPLGNGVLGAMIWGDGAPLSITLDKADLWDLRCDESYMDDPNFNYQSLVRLVGEKRFSEVDEVFEKRQNRANIVTPTKISIGRATIDTGRATAYECHLDLGTATLAGSIETASGVHRVKGFVHREMNVLCLHITDLPPDASLRVTLLTEMYLPPDTDAIDFEPGETPQPFSLLNVGYPEPERYEEDGTTTLVQGIPEGPFYALTWNCTGPDFLLAVETADSAETALAKARETWRKAAAKGFDELHAEHVKTWEAFWSTSAVYLPEKRIEFLWYYGLYLLSSACRRGAVPPGLQGVWAMDGVMPPWRGDYHNDMNVQETFWPAAPCGHLDLLDSWCDHMKECLPAAREYTRRFFGTEGTFWVCCMQPGYTVGPCWHTVQFAWSHSGWLGWLVWLRWRHSMDREWLADTGYPLVAEIFTFYRANLREEDDGCLHIPISSSPEYRENSPAAWCKDPNIDIALIRKCCDWVMEMEGALGRSDLTASARDVHEKLVPYSLTESKALLLWPGKRLDEPHRHPSQLMAIHPAMDLTIDDGEESREIIAASLRHYLSLGQDLWAGHTRGQMASMFAVAGWSDYAYDCLSQFADYNIGPNGLYANSDSRRRVAEGGGEGSPFTLEASCAVSAEVCDLLVQGWGDVLRIFPAVPRHWREVAFRDLVAEGAFRVSALRRGGRTVWVRVVAGVARELRLRNPFGDAAVDIAGAALRIERDLLVGDLEEGQEVTLSLDGVSIDFDEEARRVRDGDTSRIGLR